MKHIKLIASALAAIAAAACDKAAEQPYRIVPSPLSVKAECGGNFSLTGSTEVCFADSSLLNEAGFLVGYIKEETGLDLEKSFGTSSKGDINLAVDPSMEKEAYVLNIRGRGVSITGGSSAGVFYGVQTLRKCLAASPELPAADITDRPEFAYRGAHLDVCRHFFSVDEVKTYIDMMALHNMNKLHWHITEDQGWRMEIKKYPRLTEVGSMRKETIVGHLNDIPRKFDGKPYGGYYTQDEIRDIVKYASERHIDVIPEVDLPGHMQAALASYPELGCTGGPYDVWTIWGVSEDVLCAGNPKVYEFLDNVFTEVLDMFPSEYIHIGGDECPKVRWGKCPKCQALIAKLGLKDDERHTKEQKLQSYVMKHVADFLNARGRKVIGWDEILEGDAAPGATIMSWRGETGGIEAAKSGHDVIMTPNSYLYFDFYQGRDVAREPLAIGGYIPVERVYMYSPVPSALTQEEASHILGAQANLWTEYIDNFAQVQYMVLPRWAALAENQWRNPSVKDYGKFLQALGPLMTVYDNAGYNYAKHVFEITGEVEPDMSSSSVKVKLTTMGSPEIRYTLDGTVPTEDSPLYEKPLEIRQDADFRAVAFRKGEPGEVYAEKISFNKATARPVALENDPADTYKFGGASVLVDGLRGDTKFSSGRWLGFGNATPMTAVVDLGEGTEFSSAGAGVCICTADGIFDARKMTISVSDDGKSFREIAEEGYPRLEKETRETASHIIEFEPVKARFVKVHLLPEGEIPSWNWLAGGQAWLFVDEIIVR